MKQREREPFAACTTWREHVEPVLMSECGSCHGGDAPAGGYDLTSYLGALGRGSDDTPNAIAGDSSSVLLVWLQPGTADATHAPFSEWVPLLTQWIVDCDLHYARSRIHAGGIMNPSDAEFHGQLLQASGWNFDECAACHGDDFSGGPSGAGCLTCHEDGPTDCQTCHGPGMHMESGAHPGHQGQGELGVTYECSACHVVPEDYRDPGHIFLDNGNLDPAPVEVVFDELASRGDPVAPPRYDPVTGQCDNVYCHGATLGADENAGNTTPRWLGQDQAGCGSCHGLAPSSHADDRCSVCHPQVVDQDRAVIAPALHIDGAVSVGVLGGGECTGCHDTPRDLAGEISTELVTVGAHDSHLRGLHGLRGPIPCSDCHSMPSQVSSPGHIDSPAPAEVFESALGMFSGLASAGGAAPVWDRQNATCSDVYCHGGGTSGLSSDDSPDLMRTPVWTAVNAGQAACGTCHGAPPVDANHDPTTMTLDTCHTCHASTVDVFGNILLSGPVGAQTSEHIDGDIDG